MKYYTWLTNWDWKSSEACALFTLLKCIKLDRQKSSWFALKRHGHSSKKEKTKNFVIGHQSKDYSLCSYSTRTRTTSSLEIEYNPPLTPPIVISGRRVCKYSNITSVGLWTWLQLKFWYSCSSMSKYSATCFQHLQDPYLYSLSRHLESPSKRSRQSNMVFASGSPIHLKKYTLHQFTSHFRKAHN